MLFMSFKLEKKEKCCIGKEIESLGGRGWYWMEKDIRKEIDRRKIERFEEEREN